jgi:hypothetical protein
LRRYHGEVEAGAMAAHLAELVRRLWEPPWEPVMTASDVERLRRRVGGGGGVRGGVGGRVVLFVAAAFPFEPRVAGLLRNVSTSPFVRHVEPAGVRIGVLVTEVARRHLGVTLPPVGGACPLSLVAAIAGRSEPAHWPGGGGGREVAAEVGEAFPTAEELASWVTREAGAGPGGGPATILELTPRSLSDATLLAMQEANRSLLVVSSVGRRLCFGSLPSASQ